MLSLFFGIVTKNLLNMFKVSSPIAQGIWYTKGTEREALRKADAAAIAADNPTAAPVTLCFARKEDK